MLRMLCKTCFVLSLGTVLSSGALHGTELGTALTQDPVDLTGFGAVDLLVRQARPGDMIEDAPATQAFASLEELFGSGQNRHLRLGVYRLAPVADAQELARRRAAQLGIPAGAVRVRTWGRAVVVESAPYRLIVNADSGSELFADWDSYHRGAASSSQWPASTYASAAWAYASQLPMPAGQTLYGYKLRRYMAAATEPGQTDVAANSYQIVPSFNTAIDGLPVIGPGGKTYIYLRPDGSVIGHTAMNRDIAERIGTISGDQLLSPAAARERADAQMKEEGKDPGDYRIARSEFGYFRYGKQSPQTTVAPHYAFHYMPLNEAASKKAVQVVRATADPFVGDLLSADAAAERKRKWD